MGGVGGVGGFVPDDVPQMMVIDDLDMSRLSRLHVVRKYRVPGRFEWFCTNNKNFVYRHTRVREYIFYVIYCVVL